MLDCLSSNISDAAEEFSGTLKMSFAEMPSEQRMFAKKFKGRDSFKQLKSFANTYRRRNLHGQVHVVGHDLQFIIFATIFLRCFAQKLFAISANNVKLKRVTSILWLSDKMTSILSNAVIKIVKTFHFRCLRTTKRQLRPNQSLTGETNVLMRSNYINW